MTIIFSGPVSLSSPPVAPPVYLSDLADVSITNVQGSQYLRYDSLTSKWQNAYLNTDVFNYLNTSLTSDTGVVLTKNSGTQTINIGLSSVNSTPGTFGSTSATPVLTVNSQGRITGITTVPTGTSQGVVTLNPGPYVFSNGVPVNQRHQIITSPGNTGGFNVGPGEMEVQFELIANEYFTDDSGHLAVVLRCDTAVINSAVYGQGMIFGNVVGNTTGGAPYSPTTQIETWFNGLAPDGNYLPPESAGYASKPLQDGVNYKAIVSSKVYDSVSSYIRYRLYRFNPTFSTWDLERDTGDILDKNNYIDKTKSGLVFGQVFANPTVPPWSITITNIKTTWSPITSPPVTEVPTWLNSTGGVQSFNTRTGNVTLAATDLSAAMCNTSATKNFIWNASVGGGAVDAGDSSSIYIQRNANYSGGTIGYVNSAIYVQTFTPTNNHAYEWGITSEMNSYSMGAGGGGGAYPQNVAINGTIRKYGTAPCWGGNFAAVDPATSYTALSGPLIGAEINVSLCGVDSGLNTVGVDCVPQISNAGHTALAAIAFRASGDANAKWKYGLDVLTATVAGVLLENTGTYGVRSVGNHSVGIDLSGSTNPAEHTALRVRTGDYLSFVTTDQYTMRYNGGSLKFYDGSTVRAYIDLTTGTNVNLAGVTSFKANTQPTARTGDIILTNADVVAALGYTPGSSSGTVTSVSGTGTVSGLTLTGSVTTSGSLTLGGTLSLTSGNVTTALGYTPLDKAGDTMSGALILNADPVVALGAATKQYVDNIASGVNIHAACETSTTGVLASVTYSNGTAGVGATLTATANASINTAGIGGYTTLSVGSRVLIKDQASGIQNGIYAVTDLGSAGTPWILTRAADFDGSPTFEVEAGDLTYVQEGTLAGTQWVQTAIGTGHNVSPSYDYIIIGTDAMVFSQFSGAGAYTAGTGINIASNVISNTGVTSAVAGTNIAVSGATGAVTISVTGTVASATSATTATNIAAGAAGSLPYQSAAGTTSMLAAGTNGNVLTLAAGVPTWAAATGDVSSFNTRTGAITLTSSDVTTALTYTPYNATNPSGYTSNTGTVTSVSGTGTVSGITLTGSVTASGNLTLGGALSLTSGDVTTALGYTPATIGGFAPTTLVSGTSQLAVSGGRYALTNVATTTVTLPASPLADDVVTVTAMNDLVTNIIGANGSTIMGVAGDMVIDSVNVSITLQYINSSWRLV